MLIYGWLETRDQKPPPHTSLLSSHNLAFHISLATMFRQEGHHSPGLPAVRIHTAGGFFLLDAAEPSGYVDGRGRAWYSDTEYREKNQTGMEYRMPKKWMQSVLMIVTYTVLLVLALVKFDWDSGAAGAGAVQL